MIALEEQQLKEQLAVDEITFAIPAQSFGISCAISAEEALPVVTEFALRITYVCGSISPVQLQEFFGFSKKEVDAVIKALLDERLIHWNDDQLELTTYALARFQDSSDNLPRFFKIQEWSAEVIFDLISFSPAERPTRLKRVRSLIELTPRSFDRQSKTIQYAEQSFQRNFRQICKKEKADIYKVSEIEAGERFSIPLPCVFHLDLSGQTSIQRGIDDESFGGRLEIAEAISDAMANQDRRDNECLSEFVRVFDDEVLRRYMTEETFDLRRYVQDVHLTKVCGYSDTRVAPLLGALHLQRNAAGLVDRLKSETTPQGDVDSESVPSRALWLAPQSTLWARSRAAKELAQRLNRMLVPNEPGESTTSDAGLRALLPTVRMSANNLVHIYQDLFPRLLGASFSLMGGNLELFILPERFVCALFHFHLAHQPIAVPFGFVSSNPVHVSAACDVLSSRVRGKGGGIALLHGSHPDRFDPLKELTFLSTSGPTAAQTSDALPSAGRPRLTLKK